MLESEWANPRSSGVGGTTFLGAAVVESVCVGGSSARGGNGGRISPQLLVPMGIDDGDLSRAKGVGIVLYSSAHKSQPEKRLYASSFRAAACSRVTSVGAEQDSGMKVPRPVELCVGSAWGGVLRLSELSELGDVPEILRLWNATVRSSSIVCAPSLARLEPGAGREASGDLVADGTITSSVALREHQYKMI